MCSWGSPGITGSGWVYIPWDPVVTLLSVPSGKPGGWSHSCPPLQWDCVSTPCHLTASCHYGGSTRPTPSTLAGQAARPGLWDLRDRTKARPQMCLSILSSPLELQPFIIGSTCPGGPRSKEREESHGGDLSPTQPGAGLPSPATPSRPLATRQPQACKKENEVLVVVALCLRTLRQQLLHGDRRQRVRCSVACAERVQRVEWRPQKMCPLGTCKCDPNGKKGLGRCN